MKKIRPHVPARVDPELLKMVNKKRKKKKITWTTLIANMFTDFVMAAE